jgi:hypothetical protein
MQQEIEATLTPEFLKAQLKVIADLELSQQAADMFGLFAGLVVTMNMLQPEGYLETVPAFIFRPVKE